MAKKITIALLIMLMVGVAVFQQLYVTQITQAFTDLLEDVTQALEAEDFETAATLAQDFEDKWEKEKPLYESLFDHEDVMLISESAMRLSKLCIPECHQEALEETATALFYVQHIYQTDSVRWENIL